MKKIATGAVFVALVVASIAPAAATSRPKAAVVDAAALSTTLPTSFSTASTSSVTEAASDVPTYSSLGQGLLAYFKADLAFEGGVYHSLQTIGIGTAGLSASYAQLDRTIVGLINFLQANVSNK